MPDRFDTMKADLGRARRRGPRLGVFGERAHAYRMHPALSEVDLAAFESRYRVRLPADYREFLQRVGNGGAGPAYGLFMLGEIDDGRAIAPWNESNIGRLDAPFPHRGFWNDRTGEPDAALIDIDEPEYSRLLAAFE